ncbi:MAG: S-adenosylmethionine:tRNA ribosyltransferase-isomerase, partial [Sulfurospirillaceae bacterium]|nr:S-adenosylmethionine:tRNA ribosyltransferase-isomerase [Sulfurospirillaceae bacterium]
MEPRDHARLLVYERSKNQITHSTFEHLFEFLPQDTAVILNDTKVIKARIFGKKESGGEVEFLLNSPLPNNAYCVYIRGRVKVGMCIHFEHELSATINELK